MSRSSLRYDPVVGHVTGQSEFIDDRPRMAGELIVLPVYATIAHGTIDAINLNGAETIDGVVRIFTSADLKHNCWGPIIKDQPILADKTVQYFGEVILLIAATSHKSALAAKACIQISYTEKKPILSLDHAISDCVYIGNEQKIETGNPDTAFEHADHTIKGVVETGGQDHFYLESQAAIAYPDDNGAIHIQASSQHPTEVQHVVADALGLPFSKVSVTVKRMGGGFGGKESQASHIATFAALACHLMKRPAKIVLSKDDDMLITGKRHPFKTIYSVGFTHTGKITALDVYFYADGGAYTDLSPSILQRAIFHVDNAYYIPNARIRGRVCKTNTASNTAFRGFGGPQGVAAIEAIIEDIAQTLNKDPLDVRKINLYRDETNNTTPYGQIITHNRLPQLLDEIETGANYRERQKHIRQFNQESPTCLRGLSITPVKFGISFTSRFLNQGNALIHVLPDGTVQVSTGATEMGQGVITKIRQIVSEELGIDPESIRMMPTSTERNANTSPTAASSGSDINGFAAQKAAQAIRSRLAALATHYFDQPSLPASEEYSGEATDSINHICFDNNIVYHQTVPDKKISFTDLVTMAYRNRISLSEHAFHKTPDIYFDITTGKGNPFLYYTNGVAASEVEIDRFTGEVKVLSVDIIMDLGRPINEAIDRGQTTGAFIQGMGWVTTECLSYGDDGELRSHSPTTYKIPNIQDIPRHFSVRFIDNDTNTCNIRRSKAVGEPPFLLALSVWTAIRHAIVSTKPRSRLSLKLPATSEEVLNILNQ